jgi:hypothetical protein
MKQPMVDVRHGGEVDDELQRAAVDEPLHIAVEGGEPRVSQLGLAQPDDAHARPGAILDLDVHSLTSER